jgi:hypothetical protein
VLLVLAVKAGEVEHPLQERIVLPRRRFVGHPVTIAAQADSVIRGAMRTGFGKPAIRAQRDEILP